MATKKTAAAPTEIAPVVDLPEDDNDTNTPDQLKIKDLLERVATATDLNKNKVRAIVEATLNELGKALEAGEGANLPPLGKIRIVNTRDDDQVSILTLKLRRQTGKPAAQTSDTQALAEVGEDS